MCVHMYVHFIKSSSRIDAFLITNNRPLKACEVIIRNQELTRKLERSLDLHTSHGEHSYAASQEQQTTHALSQLHQLPER